MSKEKQIEDFENDLRECHTEFATGVGEIYTDYDTTAQKMFDKGYRKQSEWISVEERLPEDTIPTDYKYKTIKVLVAIKEKNGVTIRTQKRFLDYAYRDDERTAFWTWRFSAGNVTHWMPLPEAPKKGGAE